MNIPLDKLIHPVSKESLYLEGHLLKNKGNDERCAEIYEEELRVDWISQNIFPDLNSRILREINKYDGWASNQEVKSKRLVHTNSFEINEDPLYLKNPFFQQAGIDLQAVVKDKQVLDLGGSGIDTWRWLLAGAKEVHQVEVSRKSQHIALQRIIRKFGSINSLKGRIFFHTCPAEYLPFADQSFDFVFSRSTVHHTLRKYSLPELSRVLKREGKFLFFEPLQHGIMNKIMHKVREIRRIDRGTDDPLTMKDLLLAKSLFGNCEWHPYAILQHNLEVSFSWLSRGLIKKPAVPVIYGDKQ